VTETTIPRELVVQLEAFILSDEDAILKLESLVKTGKLLYSTDEVMSLTGWTRGYITRLCREHKIPYIAGNPHKFMLGPLKRALEDMMTGGEYGRRKKTQGKAKKCRTAA